MNIIIKNKGYIYIFSYNWIMKFIYEVITDKVLKKSKVSNNVIPKKNK